jgi:hypothetical protein
MGLQSEKGDLSSCHVLFGSEQTAGNVKIQDPKFPHQISSQDVRSIRGKKHPDEPKHDPKVKAELEELSLRLADKLDRHRRHIQAVEVGHRNCGRIEEEKEDNSG